MDEEKKSLYIARLVSGQQRFKYDSKYYILKNPTVDQLLIIEEYLDELREEMENENVLSREKMFTIMKQNYLWSDKEEKELKEIKTHIEDLKMSLFDNRYKSVQQKIIRNNLKVQNENMVRLNEKKFQLDNLSIEGILFATRLRLFFGLCIYNRGVPYWSDQDDFAEWDMYDPTIDSLFANFLKNKISNTHLRLIARTDPWTQMWSIKGLSKEGLFTDSIVCLNDEQRNLISWSNTYDFISNLQGADKLSDFIVQDDDMLDGWILRYNKSNKQESYGSDNFGKGDEVYIPVDTIEDAKRIHEMNDPITRHEVQNEMRMIDERGTMSEVERPSYIRKHNAAYAQACKLKGIQ